MATQPGSSSQPAFGQEERPVIFRSCDTCRKKKIRCEPTARGCSQCTKHGTRCHFTPIAKNRKPRRPSGFKYIAQLEKRLLEVEARLGNVPSREPIAADVSLHQEQTIHATSLDMASMMQFTDGNYLPLWENEPQSFSKDPTSNLELGVYDVPDLPIFNDHTNHDLHYQRAVALQSPSLSAHRQLPTKALALQLVEEAFTNYFMFFPLFLKEEFLAEFYSKYSTSDPKDAAWWACLNVVLAIAHRIRAIRTQDPRQDNIQAARYLENALLVVSELSVSNNSLSAVQALACLACILQDTSNPEPAAALVAVALRLAQAMNLHREFTRSTLTESQTENRRRVFWKVYILDKDISLRTGRPFGQDDDDMDVRLPSKGSFESVNLGIFNRRIGLAIIQGQVYKRLYSVAAGKQTATERAIAAQELSCLLSYWKSSAEMELPEDWPMSTERQLSGDGIHMVVLRLAYLHCLSMIDRHLSPTMLSSPNQELNWYELLGQPSNLCVSESRKAIRLIEAIPQVDCACVWMLLHAFFAATSSLLYNLTQNPMSSNAISDLSLSESFLRLLETLSKGRNVPAWSDDLVRMRHACNKLNNEAKLAIQVFSSGPSAAIT